MQPSIPSALAMRLGSLILGAAFIATIAAAEFPYQLQRSDIAVSLAAVTFLGMGTILESTKDAPPALSRGSLDDSNINRFDRSAVRRWAPGVDKFSDYATAAMLITPVTLGTPLLRDRAWKNYSTLAVMYGEAVALTAGFSAIIKELTYRNRPSLYNTTLSDTEFSDLAADNDSRRSFYSRHTALAFCSAVFVSTTATDIYGPSKVTTTAWIASCAAATAIGVSRYTAGQHFPTDILAGAALGSLAGYMLPLLHRSRDHRVTIGITGERLVVNWKF